MKAEIKLEKVASIGVATSLQDGVLMGKITCTVPVTPFSIARLLNFQKQHGVLNLIVESPQAVMDFELLDPKQAEGVVRVAMLKEPVPAPGIRFAEVKMWAEKPEEGPAVFKVQLDDFTGEGSDPHSAVLATLASAGVIKLPDGPDAFGVMILEEALKVLKEKYSDNVNAARVALVLQKNSLEVDGTAITFSNNGSGEHQPEGPGEKVKGKRGGRKKQPAEV